MGFLNRSLHRVMSDADRVAGVNSYRKIYNTVVDNIVDGDTSVYKNSETAREHLKKLYGDVANLERGTSTIRPHYSGDFSNYVSKTANYLQRFAIPALGSSYVLYKGTKRHLEGDEELDAKDREIAKLKRKKGTKELAKETYRSFKNKADKDLEDRFGHTLNSIR